MNTTEYAHPEALVETDWLAQHMDEKNTRIVESNEDILLYDTGHIPGAVHIDWRADLQDPVIRDYITPEKFAELCQRNGITPETTCIFYGDKANWGRATLWAFKLFAQERQILNGGRDKWKAEGRPMTRDVPRSRRENTVRRREWTKIRAFADEALAQSKAKKPLIDVRSPGEYKARSPCRISAGECSRRPYSRSEERSVEDRNQGRQHLQIRRELRKIYLEGAG
jgi:thiosulfate/3-mercaptopyruvate sulfurtransferase